MNSQIKEIASQNLVLELRWLTRVIHQRISESIVLHDKKAAAGLFDPGTGLGLLTTLAPPELNSADEGYGEFVQQQQFDAAQRLLVMLPLSMHLNPGMLDILFNQSKYKRPPLPESGLLKPQQFAGVLPSGLTYLYLAGGYNLADRLRLQDLFYEDNIFSREGMIFLQPHLKGDPVFSGRIVLGEKWVEYFTMGKGELGGRGVKYAMH